MCDSGSRPGCLAAFPEAFVWAVLLPRHRAGATRVWFFGGELFFDFDLLVGGIEYAQQLGLVPTTTSNVFWAVSFQYRMEDPRQRNWIDPGKLVDVNGIAHLMAAVPGATVVVPNLRFGFQRLPLWQNEEVRDQSWYKVFGAFIEAARKYRHKKGLKREQLV